jgi:hypothetical protein
MGDISGEFVRLRWEERLRIEERIISRDTENIPDG